MSCCSGRCFISSNVVPGRWVPSKRCCSRVLSIPPSSIHGPLWGQVDLFPSVLVTLAIGACFSRRWGRWALALYTLALLSKFQTVAFLPVMVMLFLRNYKRMWRGIPWAIGVVLLVLLPLMVTGTTKLILMNAYCKALGAYPFATLFASNLWMLVVGNRNDANLIPFFPRVKADHFPLILFTCGNLAKILFSVLALWVFIVARHARLSREAAKLGTMMGVGFFFLLPEMHERYLLPAVPFALLWLASDLKAWPWVLLISAVVSLNILLVFGFQGAALWKVISALALLNLRLVVGRGLAAHGGDPSQGP